MNAGTCRGNLRGQIRRKADDFLILASGFDAENPCHSQSTGFSLFYKKVGFLQQVCE